MSDYRITTEHVTEIKQIMTLFSGRRKYSQMFFSVYVMVHTNKIVLISYIFCVL